MRRTQRRFLPLVAAAIVAVASLGLADPAAAQTGWRPVIGEMSSGAARPATVALPDGRVVLMGGQDVTLGSPINTTNVYDSLSNTWLAGAAPMSTPRAFGSAVALLDGRALIAGGIVNSSTMSATAEIYDPATNTWTLTAMPRPAAAGAAVTLQDGRVLVLGGVAEDDNSTTDATMFFEPSTGTWTVGPPMLTSRYMLDTALLADGRVLVFGGISVEGDALLVADAELFDPVSNSWSPAGQMAEPTVFATSGLLSDGRVIVAGGSTSFDLEGVLARVEIYNPATNQWQTAAPMSKPRAFGGGGVTADGRLIMAAGITTQPVSGGLSVELESSAEAYDPAVDTWTSIESMTTPRYYVGSVIVNGELLVAGGVSVVGNGGALLTSGEVYVSQPNNPPVALASAPATVQGVAGSMVAVELSAADSFDPDGNPLTFAWSEGATTLATTVDPARVAVVALGVGGHTLTLTVRDTRGGESTTTVFVNVVDAAAGLQAQITQLTAALQQAQDQITQQALELQQAQAQLAAAHQSVVDAVAAIQARLRADFRDPSFVVPGGHPAAQLQAIVNAIMDMNRGHLLHLYRALDSSPRRGGPGRGRGR